MSQRLTQSQSQRQRGRHSLVAWRSGLRNPTTQQGGQHCLTEQQRGRRNLRIAGVLLLAMTILLVGLSVTSNYLHQPDNLLAVSQRLVGDAVASSGSGPQDLSASSALDPLGLSQLSSEFELLSATANGQQIGYLSTLDFPVVGAELTALLQSQGWQVHPGCAPDNQLLLFIFPNARGEVVRQLLVQIFPAPAGSSLVLELI